jgi:hypothetical protein
VTTTRATVTPRAPALRPTLVAPRHEHPWGAKRGAKGRRNQALSSGLERRASRKVAGQSGMRRIQAPVRISFASRGQRFKSPQLDKKSPGQRSGRASFPQRASPNGEPRRSARCMSARRGNGDDSIYFDEAKPGLHRAWSRSAGARTAGSGSAGRFPAGPRPRCATSCAENSTTA